MVHIICEHQIIGRFIGERTEDHYRRTGSNILVWSKGESGITSLLRFGLTRGLFSCTKYAPGPLIESTPVNWVRPVTLSLVLQTTMSSLFLRMQDNLNDSDLEDPR